MQKTRPKIMKRQYTAYYQTQEQYERNNNVCVRQTLRKRSIIETINDEQKTSSGLNIQDIGALTNL